MLSSNHFYSGNNIELAKQLDNESIDVIITSPPYYSLRSYETIYSVKKNSKEEAEKALAERLSFFQQAYPQFGYRLTEPRLMAERQWQYCHEFLRSLYAKNLHLANSHHAYENGEYVEGKTMRQLEKVGARVLDLLIHKPETRNPKNWPLWTLYLQRYSKGHILIYDEARGGQDAEHTRRPAPQRAKGQGKLLQKAFNPIRQCGCEL
jgi:hypothetical protein